ncbi:TonB-dependent receptor plug domain-containing protein [Dokdonella sp.]|uniref:TonB-dependent receptor plug domain-containing protein n=1 Tax=Dokdonella sp. TaxID=2291710 RepID=UPI002F42590B
MNHTSNELFKAVRYALYAGTTAVVGLSAAPVLAQDDTSSQKLETITVTGSNIRRVDIETSNPVVTIDRAAIEKTGKLTLGDLVQQLPAVTGPNTNPQVNNSGGSGFSSIGLRGLGSPRTLVLINGHRYLSGDPNAIPANMIERIEVLTDGASSVYGSDAIAGVVNFILRSDYQGAEFSADYGISDRDDGTSKGYSFTFGQSSDKGSIMAGVNYKKIDGVLSGHREFSKDSVSRLGSTSSPIGTFVGGSTSSPYGHIKIPSAFADLFPGCSSGYLARNPEASGLNIATDYHCYRNSASAAGPSDKYNYATVNLVMTPQERTGLFLNGNYKLTDNVEVYLNVLHNKTSAAFQLAPAVFGTPYGATVSADSYYNPFGIDFGPGAGSFNARLESLGNRSASTGTANDQLSTGFKGSFSVWNDQQWNWELGFDYGHVHQSTTTYGLPNLSVLNPGMGPSFLDEATGQVVCGTPDAPIAGCIPFNPFNLQDPNSIAALRAAASPGVSNLFSKETVKRLDLNGGLFELPAGTMQLAVGYNYRTEYIHSNVDTGLIVDFDGNCTLGSQCGSALQGGYNVKEAYAELFVPILKDLPFVHALNLTVGDRWSKYSTFGSTNNTKFAIEWRPIEDLLLRGTVSKVFRAPTIGDIFGGAGSDAPKISRDPCDGYTGGGNPACVNVPTDGSFVNENVRQALQLNAIASGAAFAGFPIGPEKGKSFDFGIVYDPHWLEGLSVSADVWRVYLNENITGIGAQQVLDLCSAGQLAFCPLIRRYASGESQGQIQTLIEPTGNLGRVDVGGVDFAMNYRLPEFSFGRFNVGLNATYLKNYDLQTAPGLPGNTTYHFAGHFENYGSAQAAACPGAGGGVCLFPRWRAQSQVGWQMGPFDASWSMRYIHRFRMGSPSPSQDSHPYGTGNPSLDGLYTDFGSTVYHDIQFGYNLESLNTRFDIGVNNVGDKQPPFLYANNTLNANTDPSDFDLMGRYYWGRVTVKF